MQRHFISRRDRNREKQKKIIIYLEICPRLQISDHKDVFLFLDLLDIYFSFLLLFTIFLSFFLRVGNSLFSSPPLVGPLFPHSFLFYPRLLPLILTLCLVVYARVYICVLYLCGFSYIRGIYTQSAREKDDYAMKIVMHVRRYIERTSHPIILNLFNILRVKCISLIIYSPHSSPYNFRVAYNILYRLLTLV